MLFCTKCGRTYAIGQHVQRCPRCNEPLQVEFMRGKVKDGKHVWERFADFYGVLDMRFSMGEGDTPLIYSTAISRKTGNKVYLKNEGVNPTWSFKDRGTFVALNRAIALGFDRVGVVSTGNMAASVAAYGARAGLETIILVSSSISRYKLAQISAYGPKIVLVDGDYGETYFESLKIGAGMGIYFMNSDDPFRVEGYKSIVYEIWEEITPDYVIVPTSSGGLIRGIIKGFVELKNSGLIDHLPVPVAAQASGCAPICRAFEKGEVIERVKSPNTLAHAISNPYPPSGNEVLRLLKNHNGICVQVSDPEILRARDELAREGVYVQPASATALAALEKLNLKNKKVVLILTGAGLKVNMEYDGCIHPCGLENLRDCMEAIV